MPSTVTGGGRSSGGLGTELRRKVSPRRSSVGAATATPRYAGDRGDESSSGQAVLAERGDAQVGAGRRGGVTVLRTDASTPAVVAIAATKHGDPKGDAEGAQTRTQRIGRGLRDGEAIERHRAGRLEAELGEPAIERARVVVDSRRPSSISPGSVRRR